MTRTHTFLIFFSIVIVLYGLINSYIYLRDYKPFRPDHRYGIGLMSCFGSSLSHTLPPASWNDLRYLGLRMDLYGSVRTGSEQWHILL